MNASPPSAVSLPPEHPSFTVESVKYIEHRRTGSHIHTLSAHRSRACWPPRATPCGQAFKKRLLPRKLSHHPFTTFFLEELVLGQACRRAAPAGARSPSSASAPSFRRDRREQRFRTCAISDACASRAFVASLRTPHLFFVARGIANMESLEMASLSAEPCEGASFVMTAFEVDDNGTGMDAFREREEEFELSMVPSEDSMASPTVPGRLGCCVRRATTRTTSSNGDRSVLTTNTRPEESRPYGTGVGTAGFVRVRLIFGIASLHLSALERRRTNHS